MNTNGIALLGVLQLATLIVGWVIASIAVRHGITWEWDVRTFGKLYRKYGLLLGLLPLFWTYFTIRIINKDWSSARMYALIAIGVILIPLIAWISFLAFFSGTGGGMIIGNTK